MTTTLPTSSSAGKPLGDRRAGQPDPRPQLEHVDRADDLAEDRRRRPASDAIRAGGELQQRRLARRRWVRGPPSARPPRPPSDVVEQGVAAPDDAHPAKARTSLMGVDPMTTRSATSRAVPRAAPRLSGCRPCPLSVRLALWATVAVRGELDPDDAVVAAHPDVDDSPANRPVASSCGATSGSRRCSSRSPGPATSPVCLVPARRVRSGGDVRRVRLRPRHRRPPRPHPDDVRARGRRRHARWTGPRTTASRFRDTGSSRSRCASWTTAGRGRP